MGRRSETGGVAPSGDRIQVRFTYRGRELRPTLPLKPTAANLKHAARIRQAVMADIKAGALNLAEYFPEYKFAGRHAAGDSSRTLREWAAVWGKLAARSLEDSTLSIYKRHLKAYWLSEFGDDMPHEITHERLLVHLSTLASERLNERTGKIIKPLGRKTQNNIMIPLRAVFEMICKADKSLTNPTDGIDNLKTQKSQPDPFDAGEVADILAVLNKRDAEIADYFEFAFFAGMRSSEQIALLWQDVDLRSGVAMVRRARVLAKDKERTKTAIGREVELNARALAVIERQRARTQLASDHVFRNPATSRPWHDEQTQRRIWVLALRTAKVRYRPPKECRDTSVTLSLQAGADPVWVAKQHGHSLMVMMKDYAKWIPGADKGRNLEAINRAISANSAVKPQYGNGGKEKALK